MIRVLKIELMLNGVARLLFTVAGIAVGVIMGAITDGLVVVMSMATIFCSSFALNSVFTTVRPTDLWGCRLATMPFARRSLLAANTLLSAMQTVVIFAACEAIGGAVLGLPLGGSDLPVENLGPGFPIPGTLLASLATTSLMIALAMPVSVVLRSQRMTKAWVPIISVVAGLSMRLVLGLIVGLWEVYGAASVITGCLVVSAAGWAFGILVACRLFERRDL